MPLEPVAEEDLSASEKTTLGELLIGFLDYYANRFDYDRDAISIRQGQRVERATLAARPKMHGEKETPPPSSSASSSSLHNGTSNGIAMHHSMSNPHFWRSQWRCVCIEEPFTNSNTAHSIYDEMVFGAIKEAFREAHAELEHNHDLDRLLECEPIKASTTNAGAAVFAATYEGERPMAGPTTIATANLRAMGGVLPPTASASFHSYQPPLQQGSRDNSGQVKRNGQQGGYQQMVNLRKFILITPYHFQNPRNNTNNAQRRSYNNQQAPKVSKSNENQGPQRQRKDNVPTSPADKTDKKSQQTARKDDG